MGMLYCTGPRDLSEKTIISKEEQLNFSSFTISEIKNAFFDLNQKTSITFQNIYKGFKRLHENMPSYKTFLSEGSLSQQCLHAVLICFIENQSEPELRNNTFAFKRMMIEFSILSKNCSKDKILEILMMEGQLKISKENFTQILKQIFEIVMDCSFSLLVVGVSEGKKIIEGNKFKLYRNEIDTVVSELTNEIFTDPSPKPPLELSLIFFKIVQKLPYDAMTTIGIRKILKTKCQPEPGQQEQKIEQNQEVQETQNLQQQE